MNSVYTESTYPFLAMLSTQKLRTLIIRRAAKASAVFDMFPDEGSVVIGLSGGADSLVLVDILFEMSRRWRKNILFMPVMIDAGFFTIQEEKLQKVHDFCHKRGMDLEIIKCHNIAEIIQSGRSRFPPCFTCSRIRRKTLLECADKTGVRTIVLGHHKDDLIETFLLNMLFSRRISAIMPKQKLFNGLFSLIRPLILVDEKYIKRYSSLRAFPVIEKTCPYTGATEREWVKKLIAKMESEKSGIKKNILRSIFYPRVDYLWGEFSHLADKLLK